MSAVEATAEISSVLATASELQACFEYLECIVLTTEETLLCSLPVDDTPDIVNISSLAIQVLKVVRMLPHVDTKYWDLTTHDWILVLRGDNAEMLSFSILDKPTPATTLYSEQSLVEFGLECIKATEL